jgi:4-hydroxy-tetrahydrodipicolinate synthase
MTRHLFSGTGVALATPFTSEGDIDFTALTRLVHYVTDGGVEYLVVLGTTGEASTLSNDERQRVFSHVAEVNAGRLPLVAGIGGNDTRKVAEEMNAFHLDGYDAILSVSPYYNKPSQEGIYRHYRAVSEAAPKAVIMYNVPGRTGMNVTAETTLRIAVDCRNIIATKEASGDMSQIMTVLANKPEEFGVISGDDAVTLPLVACGARGVISVVANAYPRVFSDMVRFCLAGDFVNARPLHYSLLEATSLMFAEGSPSGVKAFLSRMGVCGDHVRLPVVPVSERLAARIQSTVEKLG